MYGLSNHEVTAGGADFDGDGLSDAAEFAALASDPTRQTLTMMVFQTDKSLS